MVGAEAARLLDTGLAVVGQHADYQFSDIGVQINPAQHMPELCISVSSPIEGVANEPAIDAVVDALQASGSVLNAIGRDASGRVLSYKRTILGPNHVLSVLSVAPRACDVVLGPTPEAAIVGAGRFTAFVGRIAVPVHEANVGLTRPDNQAANLTVACMDQGQLATLQALLDSEEHDVLSTYPGPVKFTDYQVRLLGGPAVTLKALDQNATFEALMQGVEDLPET
jgi:hypothetical protein